MAKFHGLIGYAKSVEIAPDVWADDIVELEGYGDVVQFNRRWSADTNLSDDVTINNKISIVANSYALKNFHAIRYVTWMGTKWKVTDISVEYPRLILSIGGVYNG